MNKRYLFLVAGLVFIMIVIGGCTRPEPRAGVLDMERLLSESKRAGDLTRELSEIGKDLETEYAQRQEEIRAENGDEEELDQIYMEFVDSKQQMESQLNEEINEIMDEISEEENLEIVLYEKHVQYGGVDITEQAIEALDERYGENGGVEDDS
ncbi:MAG: OmpH family outer membrane protein [Halanaerobiales bacterium]